MLKFVGVGRVDILYLDIEGAGSQSRFCGITIDIYNNLQSNQKITKLINLQLYWTKIERKKNLMVVWQRKEREGKKENGRDWPDSVEPKGENVGSEKKMEFEGSRKYGG